MDITDIKSKKKELDDCLKELSRKIKEYKISIKVCMEEGMEDSVIILKDVLEDLEQEYNEKCDERKGLKMKESSLVEGCKHVWEISDKDCGWYQDNIDGRVIYHDVYVCKNCGKVIVVEDYE